MYCIYITFYRGNQLPPFYIGYTTTKNINRGYNGSVASKKYKSIWEQERKDRPHLFRTVIYRTYNTRQEALDQEERVLRSLNVHRNDLYINMHVGGKYFIPGPCSEETKEKLRLALTFEERSAISKKGVRTRAQTQTHEELSARSKKAAQTRIQNTPPEVRSARSKKGHETRRLRAEQEPEYRQNIKPAGRKAGIVRLVQSNPAAREHFKKLIGKNPSFYHIHRNLDHARAALAACTWEKIL